ncbi:MAG: exodeoxyribonuclease VII large subunit, partial [Clostridia bacterium]|nr:exodeoxyribonuclease VII large subunit [Clostridia bacterium]
MHKKYPRLDELWFSWDGKPMIVGNDWFVFLADEIADYFTIKDSESSLRCVMFRSSAAKLRFRPENGRVVTLTGRVSV